MVDTGIGPEGSVASGWAPVPGRLPDALDEIGVGLGDVDVVATGQLAEVTGHHRPVGRHGTAGISVKHTPGHPPGHQAVVVADGDDQIVIPGS